MSVRHACISIALLLLISSFCPLQLLAQVTPNPVPLINIPLSPTTAAPGGAGFTLTIHGTGFVATSTANWNGSPRATTFVSSSQLTVTIPSSDIAHAGTASITVTNPTPGGGTSNVATFDVTSPVSTLQFATENSLAQSGPLFAADLNGDGKIDLVVGMAGLNLGFCVQLGVGDGSFQSPVCPPESPAPTALIAGDFNGDGKLDLAGVNIDGLYIWLGNGDGTFQAPQNFQLGPPGNAPQPVTLASGDFNGDGKLDVVLASPDSGLTIFLGNGDGTFQPPVNYSVSGAASFSVAVGDFNGDGKLDVMSENVLLLGNGDGTFTQQASPVAVDQANQILTADLNGDGKLDLIVLSPGSVVVLLGNGNGTFQAPSANLDPSSNFETTMSLADFNGDGKLDLALGIATMPTPTNYILLGNGDGTFQSPIVFPNFPGAASIAADFNGDGKTDLASISGQPSGLDISVYLQGAWPALTPDQTQLTFVNQMVGTTSAAQTATLTNTGTAAVAISNIAVVGPHADFFTVTNTCGSTLAPSASCQVALTFTPAAIGTQNVTLNITDDAPGGLVSILVTGTTPPGAVAMVSPVSITFPGQYVGTSGLPQSVTLTNSGTAALSITSVTTSSADFGALNTCGNSLAAGASCSVGVFFDPTTSGTRTGTLSITDNASDSPQTITLTGSGQDFSVTPVSASATVTPGQSASYMVTVSPAGGFAQSVSLGCSGAPALSNCSISPGTIALSGSSAGMATVTITTASNGSLPPFVTNWPNVPRFQRMPTILASATTVMLLLLALLWRREQASGWVFLRGAPILAVGLLLCLAATLASCGGGSSGGSGGGGAGTQAGTYTVTVTGTFSSGATNLTHAAKLTLVVK